MTDKQTVTVTQKYQCLRCAWIGTEEEMQADFQETDDDENWSNWICPQCSNWWQLEDYKNVTQ